MASMAHMMQAMGQEVPEVAPILEINPEHDIVVKLKQTQDKELFEDVSWLLLDQAKIAEGMEVKDPISFAKRLTSVMNKAI